MTAYYNEIDPFCIRWLRRLMRAGAMLAGVWWSTKDDG